MSEEGFHQIAMFLFRLYTIPKRVLSKKTPTKSNQDAALSNKRHTRRFCLQRLGKFSPSRGVGPGLRLPPGAEALRAPGQGAVRNRRGFGRVEKDWAGQDLFGGSLNKQRMGLPTTNRVQVIFLPHNNFVMPISGIMSFALFPVAYLS